MGRTGGADGHVSVKWRTKDITAVNGKDYEGGEGVLKFDNQETSRNIDIVLHESNVSFEGKGAVWRQAMEDGGGGGVL